MPVYTKALPIPKNTPPERPVTATIEVEEPIITSIDVYFPPGCAALARVQAFYGIRQIAPKPLGSDFRGHGMTVRCPMRWRAPEVPCRIMFKGWNLDDTYDHTPLLFIEAVEEEETPPWSLFRDFILIMKRLVGI